MPPFSADCPRPDVVLLDVGGVFLLPNPIHLGEVFTRAGFEVPAAVMLEAHYEGAIAYTEPYNGDFPSRDFWTTYCTTYAAVCGVPDVSRAQVVDHMMSLVTTSVIWTHVIDGAKEGLHELLDTGVAVGVVSNADGTIAEDLRSFEILQVGPGMGANVRCVIDSGAVGVQKPDPRIFKIALDALDATPDHVWYVGDTPAIDVVGSRRAGIHPVLMDPHDLTDHLGVDRVHSMHELASRVRAARQTIA
ncbi:MAG: HAD family hydrolase [Acidimicrobiia bacterium]